MGDNRDGVLLYILAAIGALALILVLLVLVLMFFGWIGQPVGYMVRADEIERYLASWGPAIAEGGRIVVRQPATDRRVTFVKRQHKAAEQLVFRFRSAETGRRYFEQVESALSHSGTRFEIERTAAGQPRAIVISFPVADPDAMPAAAQATRLTLSTLGAPPDGPFEMKCTGSLSRDLVPGSRKVIPVTRAGLVNRFFGRS